MSLNVDYYFLVEPDWKEKLSYRRKWKTSIQLGITGFEVRSKLYTWPRRSIEYSVSAFGEEETSYLKRILFKGMSGIVGVPFWQDETVLTTAVSSGQKVLNVESTQNRNFEVGGQCILYGNNVLYEVGDIQSVASTSITLVSSLSSPWTVGTRVLPILKARVNRGLSTNVKTGSIWTAHLRFNEAFDDGIEHYVGSMPSRFQSFGNYKVMDIEPDGGTVSQDLYKPLHLLEFLGAQYAYSLYDETLFKFSGKFTFFDRENLQDFLDFFDAAAGRWGSFWLPTNVVDVRITSPFSSTDKRIAVSNGNVFANYWLNTNAGRNIIIFWPDGSYACGEVIDIEGNDLILCKPIGKGAASSQLYYLTTCLLLLTRFDQDEVKTDFLTPSVSTVRMKFRSLKWNMPACTTTTTTTSTTSTTVTT